GIVDRGIVAATGNIETEARAAEEIDGGVREAPFGNPDLENAFVTQWCGLLVVSKQPDRRDHHFFLRGAGLASAAWVLDFERDSPLPLFLGAACDAAGLAAALAGAGLAEAAPLAAAGLAATALAACADLALAALSGCGAGRSGAADLPPFLGDPLASGFGGTA